MPKSKLSSPIKFFVHKENTFTDVVTVVGCRLNVGVGLTMLAALKLLSLALYFFSMCLVNVLL